MTFKEAAAKLKEIAKGEYHALEFDLTTHAQDTGGEQETTCRVYLHRKTWYEGRTWQEAFDKLEIAMHLKPKPTEQIPDVSDKQPVALEETSNA